jgi:hypothetical protein
MDKVAQRKAILDDMVRPLAELILETAKLREESYDKAAADEQERLNTTITDYHVFYKLTLEQAAEQACPPQLVEPVTMLLRNNWNESLDWAKNAVL